VGGRKGAELHKTEIENGNEKKDRNFMVTDMDKKKKKKWRLHV
jgi:hypothetical protein